MQNISNPSKSTSKSGLSNTVSNVGIYSNFADNPDLTSFFTAILSNLNSEFNLYLEHTQDTDLFEYNERAFVGFFTNAIVRNDSRNRFSTLQEYVIYKNGKNIGRADLLVYDNDHLKYFVFEAKRKTAFPAANLIEWMLNNSTNNLTNVINQQALIYSQAEQNFFKERKTHPYLCAVYFEVISNITELSKISLNNTTELGNTF